MSRVTWVLILLACLAFAAPATAAPPSLLRIETSAGPIMVEVDHRRAPVTAGNFVRYAAEKRFDNSFFYRAARNKKNPKAGLVQGGINHRVIRARLPIAHEPTSKTGLRHVDGTLSMARNAPGTAMGDFFITVGPAAYLDARPGSVGYAAFGKVVSGMDLVRRILAAPTYPGGRTPTTKGQQIVDPIRILTVRPIR
jgi:peptidyl-prolyl cis-trans isomerase A (cyclophilin A)